MALDIFTIIITAIVAAVFYFILTLIIREVSEHLEHEHTTFHKASNVALPVVAIFILASFFSKVPLISGLVQLLSIPVLINSIRREYEKDWKFTLSFSGFVIGIVIIVFIFFATILWLIANN